MFPPAKRCVNLRFQPKFPAAIEDHFAKFLVTFGDLAATRMMDKTKQEIGPR
jgi:hypothetical protein